MRTLLLAIAFLGTSASAFAQDAPAPASVPAPAAATPAPAPAGLAPEHAGARDVLTALFIDSRIMDVAIDQVATTMLPQMRTQMQSSPMMAEISPAARDRLNAYFDSMPTMMREEIYTALQEVIVNSAPGVTALFSEREMADISEFFRQPEMRALMARIVLDPNATNSFTSEELRAATRFSRTRGGRAFEQKGQQLSQVIQTGLTSVETSLRGRLGLRAMRGFCDALADECPPEIRVLVPAAPAPA